MKKLFVCAHGTHGKDEFGNVARELFGLSAISSSEFVAQKLMFPLLRDAHNYSTWQECHADRRNHRKIWYETICDYVKDDKSKLAREIFAEYDIYLGCREISELNASRQLANKVIWVDAFERTQYSEPETSMNITSADCDETLYNNSTLEDFHAVVAESLARIIDNW